MTPSTPHTQYATSILTPEQKATVAQIFELVKGAQNILLHCHPNPDPDSLGSTLATKFALEQLGKQVTIIGGDSATPGAFMHFPGAEKVLQQNYFETDLSKFDLFLILDCGALGMISKKGEVVFPTHLKTAVIDHHASNLGYAEVNLVAVQYPSTTEILFDIFQEWGIELTHDMAVNLYVGLFTDTGGFRYDRVTEHSFSMSACLAKLAPDMIEAVKILENSGSRGTVEFLGLGFTQKKVFDFKNPAKGGFVISYISNEDIKRLGVTPEDYWNANIVTNIFRSIVGWNVICMLTEQEPGLVKASFRTRDHVEFDVSKVAGVLGGGGHKAAAGATLMMPIQDAVAKTAETIERVLG